MSDEGVVYTVEVLDAATCYSFEELCDISHLAETFVTELISYEVIVADGPAGEEYTFDQLKRLMKASRLQRDLEINTPAIALVIDLLETNQRLEQRVKWLERRSDLLKKA